MFALVPLLLFVALPPLRARTEVKYFDESVFVPVDRSFSVDVRRRGARAVLTWNAPAAPGIRVFYRVFRSRPVAPAPDPTLAPVRNGIRCLAGHAHGYVGAADCRLEMTFLGTTRARTIVDKPPRGPWVYRIGLAANWIDDTAGGDVLVLSAPAQLSARH